RLVLLTFCGPSDLEGDHIDADSLNNRLSNLRYVTHGENLHQSFRRGNRSQAGAANNRAKFTQDQVDQIRILHADGQSSRTLAEQFHTVPSYIDKLVRHE